MTNTSSKSLLFFGPSGAGKGTQVKLLMDKLNSIDDRGVVYVEMGALLREMVSEGTYSGNLTKQIIEQGALMPGFMPVYLMTQKFVHAFTGNQHIIADGAVRRPDQARAWHDAMEFYGRSNYEIVLMELSDKSIMERLLARGRNDDTEEAISKRIGWYHDEVKPLLSIFEEKGATIHHIDGEPTVPEIHADIVKTLGLA